MFSILLQIARGILNSLICVVHFSNNINKVFHKKLHEGYWCSSSITCLEKITDWILSIFTFNDKNQLYLPAISTLQIFWESKWWRSDPVFHKTIGYSPNIKKSELKQNPAKENPSFFQTSIYFSFIFFTQNLT